MNAREKELQQQGYYIFHLGKLIDASRIEIQLKEHYRTQFVPTGFPGNVHIFNYVSDGYDAQGKRKWHKEEIKDVIVAERGSAVFIEVEWEDTSDHAYQWCEIDISSNSKIYVNDHPAEEGIGENAWAVFVYEEATIELALKPHVISLDYFMGDITDISANDGVKISEDMRYLEIYGGEELSLTVTLMDGLQLDDIGKDWSVQEHDGKYTITLTEMEQIPEMKNISIYVRDTLYRYPLSDGRVECQVKNIKFKNAVGDTPVYTGEAVEVEALTLIADIPIIQTACWKETL